ncbi:MAG: ATP-binding protein [Actinomycetota bacterium]|nr:ATP-binding protein [Actinomycetota bacterium]
MRISIRLWQTALFVIVIVVATAILSVSVLTGLRDTLLEIERRGIASDASVLTGVLAPDFPLTVERLYDIRAQSDRLAGVLGDTIWVFELDGDPVHVQGSLSVPAEEIERARLAGLTDAEPYVFVSLGDGGRALAGQAVLSDEDRRVGVVVVARSTDTSSETLDAAWRRLWGSLWIALVVAGLLGLAFSDIISRRVRMLSRAANAIADGDFEQRLPQGFVPDEVRGLAGVFNRMAEQLGEVFDALKEREREIVTVVESLAEGVIAVDGIGIVRIINPAAEHILKMRAEDLLGQVVSDVILERKLLAVVERGLAGDTAVDTVRLGERHVMLHCAPTGQGESAEGAVLLLHDVTEEVLAAEAQRRFIANASHEMRTPIAAMKGFLELLDGGAKDDLVTRDEFLSTMQSEVERLSRLVADLFTLAQIDAGRMQFDIRPHNVGGLLDSAAAIMQPLASAADVTLDIAPGLENVDVWCDRDQIVQVLIGFVDNAIKHSGRGDTISLDARPHDDRVTLEVRDTGPGIPAEEIPRLFERFYRGEKVATVGRRGAGLGLAIAREIVEGHGSVIGVESRSGEGARFRFDLSRRQ